MMSVIQQSQSSIILISEENNVPSDYSSIEWLIDDYLTIPMNFDLALDINKSITFNIDGPEKFIRR